MENQEQQSVTITEPEHMCPAVIIGTKHADISEDFCSKVRGILSGSVKFTLMDYGVKRARASWDSTDEFATLKLDDGTNRTLIVKLETREGA